VDATVKQKAAEWLNKQQLNDGKWLTNIYCQEERHVALTTAYITRVLASSRDADNQVLQNAFKYLDARIVEDKINEPYFLSCYILAATAGGKTMSNSAELR